MANAVEMRLTNVPMEVYDILLAKKHDEEKRLRRACNFTDGLKRLSKDYQEAIEKIKLLEDGEPIYIKDGAIVNSNGKIFGYIDADYNCDPKIEVKETVKGLTKK